jgi:hypothetical protein
VCLIDWMDQKNSFRSVGMILEWNRKALIRLFASSRVWTLDTRRMNPEGRQTLKALLQDEGITLARSSFRVGFSALGSGHDLLGGPKAQRSPEEIQHFIETIGKSPEWGPGKRNLSRFGDYDALRDHYFAGRHVFVTRDSKGCLSVAKRPRYEAELGLLIRGAEEFTSQFQQGTYAGMLGQA